MDISLSTIPVPENKLETRKRILGFEAILSAHPDVVFGDSELFPLKHSFAPGIYVREIRIPAGAEITGKIHLHSHPNFLMNGTVEVVTEDGGYEKLVGPVAMISPPGTKRGLKALTDLWWITVHLNPSNTQDLSKLEKEIIAPSYDHYERFIAGKKSIFRKLLNIFK